MNELINFLAGGSFESTCDHMCGGYIPKHLGEYDIPGYPWHMASNWFSRLKSKILLTNHYLYNVIIFYHES